MYNRNDPQKRAIFTIVMDNFTNFFHPPLKDAKFCYLIKKFTK